MLPGQLRPRQRPESGGEGWHLATERHCLRGLQASLMIQNRVYILQWEPGCSTFSPEVLTERSTVFSRTGFLLISTENAARPNSLHGSVLLTMQCVFGRKKGVDKVTVEWICLY
uniref:Uncharacterized protein n=1 Tax=Setaria viridis TaxID=4556 RepID=A0A4U6W9G7_SETVI|nr:hypothetical protein SEVIR_1G052801v2 [Setaria viridis]